jgi:hypothetical protein
VTLLLTACHRSDKKAIRKIEFAQGTCFGPCVPMAISIDSSLKFTYYADSAYSWSKPKHLEVSYKGKADRKLWEELTSRLEDLDYRHIKASTRPEIMDTQKIEIIVYYDTTQIRITRTEENIRDLVKFIRNSPALVKLQPINDTLHFGTTLQISPPI